METNTNLPQPDHGQEPKPTEHPNTERPKRRRIMQPVFSTRFHKPLRPHLVAIGFALLFGASAHAQTSPSTTPNADPNRGWVMFDDRVGTDLDLRPDQLQKLRDVDARYQKEYTSLGNEPTRNPQYSTLSQRRAADIRRIMDPTVYERWNLKYNVPNTIQNDIMETPKSPSQPPPPTP